MSQRVDIPVPIGAGCRGINQYSDPRMLGDDELLNAANLFPNTQGLLESRPTVGFSELGPQISSANIWGWALAAPETGYRYVGAFGPNAGVYTLKAWLDASTVVSINLNNPLDKRPLFLNFNGETLCFPRNGEEGVYVLQKVTGAAASWIHRSFVITDAEATAFGVTAQPQSFPVAPEVAFVYSGGSFPCLVLANFGADWRTTYLMSDYEVPATYVAAPGQYLPSWAFIGANALTDRSSDLPDTSDFIRGGADIQLQAVGSPVQDGGLLLCEKTGYIMQGRFAESTDAAVNLIGTFSLSRINVQCGISAQGTLTRTPYGTIWAGADDVWFLDLAGQLPRRIGTKLRPTLLTAPPSARWRWTGAYFNGVYILGVCTEEERNANGNINPDHFCNFQYFWLDLRQGPPPDSAQARWFGPMTYKVSNLSPNGADQDFYTGLGQLVSTNRGQSQTGDTVLALLPTWDSTYSDICDVVTGTFPFDVSSQILADALPWPANSLVEIGRVVSPTTPNGKFFVCTTAGTSGNAEPSWSTSSVSDNTVTWQELSAGCSIFTGQPISNLGYVGGLSAVGLADFDWSTKEYTFGRLFNKKTVGPLEVGMQSSQPQHLNVQYQEEMGAIVENTSIDLSKLGAALPFTLGTQLVSEQPSYRALRPADNSRITANSVRFRGYPSDGFIVDGMNDIIIFNTGGFTIVQVPHGNYATVDDLANAIAAAIQSTWRAVIPGVGAGTVGYTVGNNSGFPTFARYQPVKFTWAGWNALSLPVTISSAAKKLGPLPYLGFSDPTRTGAFTDNGSLYAHSLVPPINPTRWRFIGAQLRARVFNRRSLGNQG